MKQTKKNRRKRVIKWILISILIVFLAAITFAYFYSERFLKEKLITEIAQKTHGTYNVSIEALTLNPFTQSIFLDQLEVNRENPKGGYFSANSCAIEHIDLFQLLTKKELQLQKLIVDRPKWNFWIESNDTTTNQSPFSFVRELSPVFKKRLHSIAIDQIELTGAGFVNDRLSKSTNNGVGKLNFNVGITNFKTDSATIKKAQNFFKADDIYLSIDNYKKELNDSTHELTIQKILYSLKNKDIKGKNIRLYPVDSTKHTRTLYQVEIPEIRIKSDNLRNIFHEDSIVIDSLFLEQATIKVVPAKGAPGINLRQIKEYDLYQLVEGEFSQLKIKYLSMNAKKLRIERENSEQTSTQEFDNLHVHLNDFLLNDTSYADPEKVLYSDKLLLQIAHYYLLMNDGIHRFDANDIKVDSRKGSISANQLQLKPSLNPNTSLTTVDMNCDSIRLADVDLRKLFHKREMPLQAVLAYKPIVTIEQGEKQDKNTSTNNSLLYHFIGNYIKGVYANLVSFDQGHFVINTREKKQDGGIIACDFSFKLTDFSLDSVSARKTDKLFYATNIELNFSNYKMKLADQIHKLEVENINVSSHKEQASMTNLHLFPDDPKHVKQLLRKYNRSQIYNIEIPYMVLKNTNIHQAFFRKKLKITNFSIVEPKIYFEVFPSADRKRQDNNPRELYDLVKNYMKDISIGKISASNGSIQIVKHTRKRKTISINNKFSIELKNFLLNDAEIEKKKLLFADEFKLKIEDHLFQLSDNVHYLQANEIDISSKTSEMFIKNAILYPDITSKYYNNLPWLLYVNIPEIKLKGVDLEEAYFKKKLAVDQLYIQQPEIKIYRKKGRSNELKLGEVSVPLPKELQLLSINQFDLNDGLIKVFNADKLDNTEILKSAITMTGNNSSLISQGINKPATFRSDNITAALKDFSFTPEKGNLNYLAKQVNFSTKEQDLKLTGFVVKNKKQQPNTKSFQLSIPSLTFADLNLDKAINNNLIHFHTIQAQRPQLTIHQNAKDSSHVHFYQLKIPQKIAPIFGRLMADQIDISEAELNMVKGSHSNKINNINLSLQDFALDTFPANRLFAARSVKLNLKNYAFNDQKNYYNFHFDDITFNNQNKRLSISGLSISPRYSKEQFQKIIPYQLDHYQGKIENIELADIDLKRWYKKHELTGSEVALKNANLTIYRDKRTPFDENQRSQLPQDLIKNFDIPFYFDSITLKNAKVSYEEQAPEMPLPGKVFFSALDFTASPVTNLPYLLNAKRYMTLKADALLMGDAKLTTTMQYDMLSPVNSFHVSGSIAPCDLTILNPITTNTAGIAIRSGQLNRFDFDFDANDIQANGKLRFAYDDLKVSILAQKNGNTKEAKFASFLTNSLVLKSKHPRTRILLPDEIQFNRDTKRSIINYWWKAVFSGAKNTFGIKSDNE